MKSYSLNIYGSPSRSVFDVREIFEIISVLIPDSYWIVRVEECFGHSAPAIYELTDKEIPISAQHLNDILKNVEQVVDGKFTAFSSEDRHEKILELQAVDSSYFDIFTDNSDIVDAIEIEFGKTQTIPA